MKLTRVGVLFALVAATTLPAMARGGGGGGGHSHSSSGTHYVAPHVTKNGTYVEGHMQTNPNGTKLDNWSTKGNVNPYTGQPGTKDPYGPPTSTGRVTTTPTAQAPQAQQAQQAQQAAPMSPAPNLGTLSGQDLPISSN